MSPPNRKENHAMITRFPSQAFSRGFLTFLFPFFTASLLQCATLAVVLTVWQAPAMAAGGPTQTIPLSGNDWLLAPDPKNVGQTEKWWEAPRPDAKQTKVPWIIQDAFPGYHGVAWYWRDFPALANPHRDGRYLLRFWQVDYMADVWLNGQPVGHHEGGESPFILDVTKAIKPGATNHLAVRVLNPTNEPIDGIVLAETPHRNKALPYSPGSTWDQGGILDDLELLIAPPVRIADVFARPDWKTGDVRIQAIVHNAGPTTAAGHLDLAIAPAATGQTFLSQRTDRELPPGDTLIETQLRVDNPRLWDLKEPFLYRLTADIRTDSSESFDEHSVRFGFRDFRVENGAFRLNGRRIYLRSSHTCNCCPIGLELPHDPDYLRRDLINAKFMGSNAIRFIAGVAKRYQLDLCDEIGLMVYEESYASWCTGNSPKLAERYDESVLNMIRRDRNHPCITMFGLLNETYDGPVFRHAVSILRQVRALDDTRLLMLNSGSWNATGSMPGIAVWHNPGRLEPFVTFNTTQRPVKALGITWSPGQLAFHPGREGQYAAVRWTAPSDGKVDLSAVFTSIAAHATTDVHVLHNGRPLYDAFINVKNAGPKQTFNSAITAKSGDTIDCVCGYGNGNYGADTTALALTLKTADRKTYDAAADFSGKQNPNGPWSYGQMPPGPAPQAASLALFPTGQIQTRQGMVSNPGSKDWQDILDDQHPYQRVPHTAGIIHSLRTLDGDGRPLFISEYGIGSGCDLLRLVRLYEQAGKPDAEDAKLYRSFRDQFLADWHRWKMSEAFGRPEDFFAASNARVAGQRLLGLNAIRSNPSVIGYSLTGTVDQVMCGEGLWTTFRELKPGTADAVFDGFAPLRWCLFAEPVNVYRKTPVHLEAVLANEDVLAPGQYPVKLEVIGPEMNRAFEKTITLTIPDRTADSEPPMVLPAFEEDVVIDGPAGKYRFTATFQSGAAAAGESIEFYVDHPAAMPPVDATVTLWGDDPDLAKWLAAHNIHTRPFSSTPPAEREVILAGAKPPSPGRAAAFRDLAARIAAGSTAIFLCPQVFSDGKNPTAWLPLKNKGALTGLTSWLYHKDEWCKHHPIFDGLPAPGLMDYTFYRDLIPDIAFTGQDPPPEAVAGATNTAIGYSSGLLVAVYPLGSGKFILNTLNIRENLGPNPPAERLLRNLLRYAATAKDKPPTPLPTDFDEQLEAMGY
jgi:hypothetical protein